MTLTSSETWLPKGLMLRCMLAALTCGGCVTEVLDHDDAEVISNALCGGVQVSWSPFGSTVSGLVTVTASGASCAAGQAPEYRFFYRREGTGSSTFTELQPWSSSATAPWDSSMLPSGKYSLMVYARAQGTAVSRDSSNTKTVLVGNVCPSVTLSASPTGVQPVGTLVTLSAVASCTGGTAEYRFMHRAPGSTAWQEAQVWSASGTLPWNSMGQPTGVHTLQVQVRRAGNLVLESQRNISVTLGEKCSSLAFTVSPAGSSGVAAPVSLSATASCTGSAQPEFQYAYRPAGTTAWTVVRPWNTLAAATWDTTAIAAGPYQLRAEVRANDFAGAAQQSRTLNHTLGDFCGAVSLVAPTPKSPQPLGTAVQLGASATCASGTPHYRFSLRAPGATTDTLLQDWGALSSFTVTSEPIASGVYTLKVEARASGAAATQATATRSYQFGGVCNTLAFSALTSSPGPVGNPVAVQAIATCTGGATAEYLLSYRPGTTGTWTNFHGWSPTGMADWDTSALAVGTYQLRAQARGQGNAGAAESSRTIGFELVSDTDGDGYSTTSGDCDDGDPQVHPGAPDTCNGGDDDCDLVIDEGNSIDAFFEDADGDGYGNPSSWMDSCAAQAGFVANAGDCDDADPGRSPASAEVCGNAVDENCDGSAANCTTTAIVSGGGGHTCALRSDGLLYCWGDNRQRQIYSSAPSTFATPRLITHNVWTPSGDRPLSVVKDVHAVATGGEHTCVLRRNPNTIDGHYAPANVPSFLWSCWGRSDSGQTASGRIGLPASLGRPEQIVAGDRHTCIRMDVGTVYCWGSNGYGQLGNGSNTEGPYVVQVVTSTGPLTGATDLATTLDHTCAISAGKPYCWGRNGDLQIAFGLPFSSNVATLVPNVTGTQIAASGNATCVLTNGATVTCWGGGSGVPTTVDAVDTAGTLEVRAGLDFMCARRTAGVVCWGSNTWSQLNAGGTVAQASTLITRAGLQNCAVAGGELYCWGKNDWGQCGTAYYSSVVTGPTLVSNWPTQ